LPISSAIGYNNNYKVLSYKVGPATWMKRRHNALSYMISLSNSLISRSFLIVSVIVFLGLPITICLSYLIYSPYCRTPCLLSTCPNHLGQVSTIFYPIDDTPTLSFVIHKPISTSFTPHLTQHFLLYV
jgi:hypothetical protein